MRRLTFILAFVLSLAAFGQCVSNAGLVDVCAGGHIATSAANPFTNIASLSLNGTNQYVDGGNNGSFTSSDSRTFSAWVNLSSFSSFVGIISKQDPGSSQGFVLGIVNNAPIFTPSLVFQIYDGSNGWRKYGGPTINTGAWYHLAVVYAAGAVTLYVNGTGYSPSTQSFGSGTPGSFATTATLQVGTWPILGNYLNGLVDELAIFNSALSSSDIAAIYNSGHPASVSSISPTTWLRFENDNFLNYGSSGIIWSGVNSPTFSTSVP